MKLIYFPIALFLGMYITPSLGQSVLEGPDAPVVDFSYSQDTFTLDLYNPFSSNNYSEVYMEMDPMVPDPSDPAQHWRFQGYIIYQLLHDSVGLDQLGDIGLARIVGQSDLQDTITVLYNTEFDSLSNTCAPVQMVSGSNAGTQLTYNFSTDVFSSAPFQPNETYCFLAVAYASNLFRMNEDCPNDPQHFLMSTKGPNGVIPIYCVSGNSLGFDDLQNGIDITVYPNPSEGLFTCTSRNLARINIIDQLGRTVKTMEFEDEMLIDLSGEPRGTYYLELITESAVRGYHKVVLN